MDGFKCEPQAIYLTPEADDHGESIVVDYTQHGATANWDMNSWKYNWMDTAVEVAEHGLTRAFENSQWRCIEWDVDHLPAHYERWIKEVHEEKKWQDEHGWPN